MIKAVIQTKDIHGKYKSVIKIFNDQQDLENYESLLERKGVKVIGTEIINENEKINQQQHDERLDPQ